MFVDICAETYAVFVDKFVHAQAAVPDKKFHRHHGCVSVLFRVVLLKLDAYVGGNFVKSFHVLIAAIHLVQQLRTDKTEVNPGQLVAVAGGVEHTHVGVHGVPQHKRALRGKQTFKFRIHLGEVGRSVEKSLVEVQIYADIFPCAVQVVLRFGIYPYIAARKHVKTFVGNNDAYAANAARHVPVRRLYVKR